MENKELITKIENHISDWLENDASYFEPRIEELDKNAKFIHESEGLLGLLIDYEVADESAETDLVFYQGFYRGMQYILNSMKELK